MGDETGHAGTHGVQDDVAVVLTDRPDPDAEADEALTARTAGLVVRAPG